MPSSLKSPGTSASSKLAWQLVQEEVAIEPCTSTTRSEPAARCSRSTFWVITASSRPRRSSSASASWAGFGRLSPSIAKRGR